MIFSYKEHLAAQDDKHPLHDEWLLQNYPNMREEKKLKLKEELKSKKFGH